MPRPDPIPAAIDPPPADTPAPARALIERQIARLDRLAEIGMEIAEELARAVAVARRRERIHLRVERAIEADLDDEGEIERLSSDAWERLEDEDETVLAGAPVGEVVARICRDLGLAPEWVTGQGEAQALEIAQCRFHH